MTHLDKLRGLAEAATPGPWVAENYVDEVGLSVIASLKDDCISNPTRGQVCHVSVVAGATGADPAGATTNAAFIAAANPATILALLDRIVALEGERDALLDRLANKRACENSALQSPALPSGGGEAVNANGYPETIEGHLAVAARVLKGIAAPTHEDGCVIYSVSDDVPEDIAVALSYIKAAQALAALKGPNP